jgi:thioredoxin reductase (NADPH)
MENKKLNIPGEKDYQGIGISYCVTCDGNLTKNKVVTIYGNIEETISSAVYLSTIASKVQLVTKNATISSKFSEADLKSKNIEVIYNAYPYEIEGDAFSVSNLVVKQDNSIIKIHSDFIFVVDGYVPATNFINELGIIENDIVKVDENKATIQPGIYAVGDVSKRDNRQIITASNDGAIAGMQAVKYVKEIFKHNDTK